MGLSRLDVSGVKESGADFSLCESPRVTTRGVSMHRAEMFRTIISTNQKVGLKYVRPFQFFELNFT